jgi:hypothetical protein
MNTLYVTVSTTGDTHNGAALWLSYRRCMMKPSPPKRPAPKRFWKAMPIATPRAAQRKESLADRLAPELAEVEGQDPSRVGSGEGHPLLARPPGGEDGHEQAQPAAQSHR